VLSEDYVVNPKNKGVRWVLVFLAPAGKKPLPIHPDLVKPSSSAVTLTIWFLRYRSHVIAMRQGQNLIINNSAPVHSNACWSGVGPKSQSGNVLIPLQNTHVIRNLKAHRMVLSMRDNIHPWMKAWIKVFDHPYFAVTNADGAFKIPKAPAGKYRLITWQESTGWGPGGKAGLPVTIQGGEDTVMRLKLMPEF
jgi:hypothetical protein